MVKVGAWLVLAYGEARQYAGNLGYEDVLTTHYRYDTHVANHAQIKQGDIFFIRGRDELQGVARVVSIAQEQTTKQLQRCPECKTAAIKARIRLHPRYRCDKGHEFQMPFVEDARITQYTARYGNSYVAAQGGISVAALKGACPKWNGQLAMQRLNLDALASELDRFPVVKGWTSEQTLTVHLQPDDSDENIGEGLYAPGNLDTRTISFLQIRQRRGQGAFRQSLVARYGPRCVVSGCCLLDLLEAAHIRPYRGGNDHHVENGLLLRADIHTLFDLDMIGIEPDSLAVEVHPAARRAGYDCWQGVVLNCRSARPSRIALDARWEEFRRRLIHGETK